MIPLADLQDNMDFLDTETPLMIHCAGGYRSVVAASLMKRNGFSNITNVHGGWGKIKSTNVPIATGAPSNLITD